MLLALIFSTLSSVSADDDVLEDIGDSFDEPEDWTWETGVYIGIAVLALVLIGVILRKVWKKCKKHYKHHHKKHHDKHRPLLEKDCHAPHVPTNAYPIPPGYPVPVNYGYVDPNAYPYLPPPVYQQHH